jgi:hypothetical protein
MEQNEAIPAIPLKKINGLHCLLKKINFFIEYNQLIKIKNKKNIFYLFFEN